MNSHYTIHTLPVLRNEIKMYSGFKRERDKLIQSYIKPLRELNLKLFEAEQKLTVIKSPGKGDGLGGYVQESDERFNDLIKRKDEIRNEMYSYISNHRDGFLEEVNEWNKRIATVEHYLSKMDAADRKFIEDFYYNLSKKKTMERYNIMNINSLYRKSDKIIKKLL